jgi:hypothetical protein
VASNVEDGVGFLGGVLTRTIHFDTCRLVTTGSSEFREVASRGSPPWASAVPR